MKDGHGLAGWFTVKLLYEVGGKTDVGLQGAPQLVVVDGAVADQSDPAALGVGSHDLLGRAALLTHRLFTGQRGDLRGPVVQVVMEDVELQVVWISVFIKCRTFGTFYHRLSSHLNPWTAAFLNAPRETLHHLHWILIVNSFGSVSQEVFHFLVVLADETDHRSHVHPRIRPHGLQYLAVLRGPVADEGAPGWIFLLGVIVPGNKTTSCY